MTLESGRKSEKLTEALHQARHPILSTRLVLIMAIACGQSVANLYYPQPLLHTLALTFDVGPGLAGLIVTFTQFGYVLGLIFLVPLGDHLDPRRLIPLVSLLAAAGLVMAASASDYGIFLAASLVYGLASVVAMLLVPMAALLAGNAERGRVVGTIMSGLLLGILLARTISGTIADWLGWREMFWIAAAGMVFQAFLLWRSLPSIPKKESTRYRDMIAAVGHLLVEEPVLVRRTIYGGLMFATFGALWTCLPFLLSLPPYNYSDTQIGLFGLLGASGAMSAHLAGRMCDRGWAKIITGLFIVCVLISFIIMDTGWATLVAIVIGVVVMDFGMQGVHVTNQSIIYRLRADAHNRITSAYMTGFFIGGSIGSSVSAQIYEVYGWAGICLFCISLSMLALLYWLSECLSDKPQFSR